LYNCAQDGERGFQVNRVFGGGEILETKEVVFCVGHAEGDRGEAKRHGRVDGRNIGREGSV
jgi:hypothetical protein